MQVNPTFLVLAAQTNSGKTLISSAMIRYFTENKTECFYLKPIQTGFPQSDDRSLVESCVKNTKLFASETIVTLTEPCSPDIAAHLECLEKKKDIQPRPGWKADSGFELDQSTFSHLPSEKNFKEKIKLSLNSFFQRKSEQKKFAIVEGAGGVLSPCYFKKTQADFFRHFDWPVILVCDPNLGGISATLSAIESLSLRGFKIVALVCLTSQWGNFASLKTYNLDNFALPFFVFEHTSEQMGFETFYFLNLNKISELVSLVSNFFETYEKRAFDLMEAGEKVVWWPFTQHKVTPESELIVRSPDGYLDIISKSSSNKKDGSNHYYNGTQSWWTGSLPSLQSKFALTAAATIARYGHVLFAESLHEPAINLATSLVSTVGLNWAEKVFFTDNGSTAIEVALKMAFRYSHKYTNKNPSSNPPVVLGLQNSYHGDTLGAQCVSSPNDFNLNEVWYSPRGFWLEYPRIVHKKDGFQLVWEGNNPPNAFLSWHATGKTFDSLESLISHYDTSLELSVVLLTYIDALWPSEYLGALLIEPGVQGSAGMHLVLPIFQRILIDRCKNQNIPVIFDEVFTGFGRLGMGTGAQLLQRTPDIACYSKALSGGVLPLGATLSRMPFFEAFLGDDKSTALLHGHSYTAYPAACATGFLALTEMQRRGIFDKKNSPDVWWWNSFSAQFANYRHVVSCTFIGNILAIEFEGLEGYSAGSAKKWSLLLNQKRIKTRALGNILYVLSHLDMDQETYLQISEAILSMLKLHSEKISD